MELLRPELGRAWSLDSAELERIARRRREVEVAGLVVARQRPATAKGVVLHAARGRDRDDQPDRAAAGLRALPRGRAHGAAACAAQGRLEHREGAINVVVAEMAALERPDLPLAEVRTIEPPVRARDRARGHEPAEAAVAESGAVAPAAHSFGRRGR